MASAAGGLLLVLGLLTGALSLDRLMATVFATAGATAFLARWFRRRAGGLTGDFLGTVQQVTEVVIMASLVWR